MKDPIQPRPADTARLGGVGRLLLALAATAATIGAVALGTASGQSLTERLDQTQSSLNRASTREGVLSSKISRESDTLRRLQGEVAVLRSREAEVAAQLRQKQAELREAQKRLEILRAHLRRSVTILEDRLVEIYKSGNPDLITVLLNSDGFDDMVERAGYLQVIEDQDSTIVERVRDLRDQTQATVDEVKAARDAIAERRQQLASTRATLEQRSSALAAARQAHAATLADVRSRKHDLEGDLTKLSEKIAEQLGSGTLPPGPIRPGQAGFIWPVSGPVVSGFGPRWGSFHEGIDIAVPTGTPIRAAKAGNIVLAGYTGGYGNYTCIDHGGGLSTCYAHQESFVRTSGYVGQGTIIGYTDCTGHCFGPHLHFEVRINGQAVDPLSYL
jgi:murein DD-endopeptidase MepM/ murein hydrolase activator NlpD